LKISQKFTNSCGSNPVSGVEFSILHTVVLTKCLGKFRRESSGVPKFAFLTIFREILDFSKIFKNHTGRPLLTTKMANLEYRKSRFHY
jgi:hypothetical protein